MKFMPPPPPKKKKKRKKKSEQNMLHYVFTNIWQKKKKTSEIFLNNVHWMLHLKLTTQIDAIILYKLSDKKCQN